MMNRRWIYPLTGHGSAPRIRGARYRQRPFCRSHWLSRSHHELLIGTQALEILPSDTPETSAFKSAFSRFIVDFGHLSDSGNDFSSPRWRETPDLILNLILGYQDVERETDGRLQFEDLDLPLLKRRRLRKLKEKTLNYMLYRERIGSLYTYGQSLCRIQFLALGRRMTENDWIDRPEDIFYLHWHEIVDWIRGPSDGISLRPRVQQRRVDVEASRDLGMPEIVYGDAPPLLVSRDESTRVLNGTPTSPGRYRGPACVVHGIRDFGKIQPGDVLIVPFSDVGWTPLFTKASAVVAESGGMLSHSSIIAREYEIPAVVSVNHACRLIADGTPVLVDGYHGHVSLEIEAAEPTKSGKEQREQ